VHFQLSVFLNTQCASYGVEWKVPVGGLITSLRISKQFYGQNFQQSHFKICYYIITTIEIMHE
jgi:hypothetical protein